MSTYDELDDDRLDARLRDVAPPVGLRSRLQAVTLDDAELTQRLRAVTIPFGLVQRLRKIAAGPAWTSRRLAAAAALFLVVGGWYALLVGSFVGLQHEARRQLRAHVDRGEAASVAQNQHPQLAFDPIDVEGAKRPDFAGSGERNTFIRSYLQEVVQSGSAAARAVNISPLDQLLLAAADGGTRAIEAAVLGAPSPKDDLPDARFAVIRVPRGVEAALSAAERRFLLDRGVFPFVSPAAFMASAVPPSFDTTGFELAREHAAAGKLPPAAQMRVEEFLAACDVGLPRAPNRAVRLHTAGGVAPWNGPLPADVAAPLSATRLLQVSVQAGELPNARRKPTYLTVGVDVTSSMSAGSRLTMVRQALATLAEKLGPNDRLTLVSLGAESTVLIDEAGRSEIDQVLAAVESLRPQGAGRLADGVFKTLLAAGRRAEPKNVERRVVIVSDACGEFDPAGIANADQFLKTDAGRGLRLDVVDVGPDDWDGDWAELARRHGGLAVRANTTDRIRAALRQSLTGQDQLVAREVNLTVTFHPDAVAAYRLFGHEPTPLTAGLPQRVEFDLAAGQSGTVLYELKLLPGAPAEVATVVLKWRDSVDGEPHEVIRSVTRGQVSPALERAAPSLQMAALAAATSGWLRNSPLADNVAPNVLLQWARRLDRTRTVRGLEPWLQLLADLDRLASRKPAARGMR